MLKSIVHIESNNKNNKSFGTGFVIDNDKNGTYILTCHHVLEEVETAIIENEEVEIIATSDFLDMAVIYIKTQIKALPLQLEPCLNKEVHVIGFSVFSRELVQKQNIQASLFKEPIQLHSKVDDSFYIVRRIKANDDYSFERGNSGAPVLCKATGAVIAMISNKKGSNIAYAIEISSLREIWKVLDNTPSKETLLTKHPGFYNNIKNFKNKLKKNFQERKQENNKNIQKLNDMNELHKEIITLREKLGASRQLKYYLPTLALFLFIFIVFYLLIGPDAYEAEDYKVVNIPTNDVLNIRDGKGTVYPILGVIPYDAQNVAVSSCQSNDAGKEWCDITYGSVIGWVRSKYIEKASKTDKQPPYSSKNYFRTENDDIFLQFTYPPFIKRGEKVFITALMENLGEEETTGGLTLSFPQRPLFDYEVIYNDFTNLNTYKVFDKIYNNHPNQKKAMKAIHPTIEAQKHEWKQKEKHVFALNLQIPETLDILKIRIRGSLTLKRVIPEVGTPDQQAFFAKEIVIKIED